MPMPMLTKGSTSWTMPPTTAMWSTISGMWAQVRFGPVGQVKPSTETENKSPNGATTATGATATRKQPTLMALPSTQRPPTV